MKVMQIRLKKAQLDRMPEEERTLLLMLGCYGNEISTIYRLTTWSTSLSECAHVVEDVARTSQVLFLVRILVGKLTEFHKSLKIFYFSLKIFYFGKKLSKRYNHELSSSTKDALRNFCRDMDSNVFSKIRNKRVMPLLPA